MGTRAPSRAVERQEQRNLRQNGPPRSHNNEYARSEGRLLLLCAFETYVLPSERRCCYCYVSRGARWLGLYGGRRNREGIDYVNREREASMHRERRASSGDQLYDPKIRSTEEESEWRGGGDTGRRKICRGTEGMLEWSSTACSVAERELNGGQRYPIVGHKRR